MAETDSDMALRMLKISKDGRVATITKTGLEVYRNNPDPRVQKALQEYEAHCRNGKPATE